MILSIRRFLRNERGNMAVEVVILAPILTLFIAFLVVAGRSAHAENSTQTAAMSAARAASLSRDAASATRSAEDAARRAMATSGVECTNLQVIIDASGLNAPIGTTGIVSASITCTVNLTDVTLPGIPGTKDLTSSADSPVDAYRARR